MIQLFDVYNQETQDLHHSLLAAGISCPTIIIEPNGFLADDMISPYTYFLNSQQPLTKARYFNQLTVPPFWEITGNNQEGRISYLEEEKAKIYYAENRIARLVKQVDWLDKKGHVRLTDHYDKYGNRFAQTVYNADQTAITSTYFSADGQERIVENHVTGDIILSLEEEPVSIFNHRLDFLRYFLERLEFDLDHILFNSLSTSFLLSYSLPADSGRDILFWQEAIDHEIPGNMQLILQQTLRTQKIVITDAATYEKARSLLPPEQQHKLVPLGYHYEFKRDNFLRKDVLILTHSDQIEEILSLIIALPQVTFRIAALTEMSQKLLSLLSYQNVVLYQNASPQQIEQLFQLSDIYLDINSGDQVLQAVRKAFEHNLLLLAFESTIHDKRYIAPQHIFKKEQAAAMAAVMEQALASVEGMREALLAQGRHANDIPESLYRQTLNQLLGE